MKNVAPIGRPGQQITKQGNAGYLSPSHSAAGIFILDARYPSVKPDGLSYLFRSRKDQLFICHNPVQSGELRKMTRGIKAIPQSHVEWRREHEPFAQEIDLAPRT